MDSSFLDHARKEKFAFGYLTGLAKRLEPGCWVTIEWYLVDEAFPHPYRPSRAEVEESITLAIDGNIPPPEWDETTQEEKIEKWAKEHDLHYSRDLMTGVLEIRKHERRCERCAGRLEPWTAQIRDRVREPSTGADLHALVVTTSPVEGHRCRSCGHFVRGDK